MVYITLPRTFRGILLSLILVSSAVDSFRFFLISFLLGPKLYNAYASVLDSNHNGSTRLHLDVADAVNVMVYAGKHISGVDGYATWQIFSPDDTPYIRKYLRERHPNLKAMAGDPIHNQSIYLTPDMLDDLATEYHVCPYVVRQRVGEAVFIPAGSAHQVVRLLREIIRC